MSNPKIKEDEVSEDLKDMMGGSALEEEFPDIKDLEQKINAHNLALSVSEIESHQMQLVTSEEYVQEAAYKVYNELSKQAKSYIREWCIVNNHVQNVYRQKALCGPFILDFEHWVYNIAIRKHQDVNTPERIIASQEATITEARFNGAITIGFSNSLQYQKAWNRIPFETAEVLKNNLRYFNRVKVLLRLREINLQISQYKGSNYQAKLRWTNEIKQQINTALQVTPIP